MDRTRRDVPGTAGAAAGALLIGQRLMADPKPIQGFEKSDATAESSKGYVPISDRKLRVGLVGHGVCKFGVAFGFQDHPNVEVVAVSDLLPDRCAEMAKAA